MYIELYDESNLYERAASFKNKSNTLLEKNGAAQHYQYENAIMTYLWDIRINITSTN